MYEKIFAGASTFCTCIGVLRRNHQRSGFDFPQKDVEDIGGGMTVVNRYSYDGTHWFGFYRGSRFVLFTKASGGDRIWQMMSSKRGDKLFRSTSDNVDVRSSMQLIEIDCTESKFRNIAGKTYAGYFGEGRQLYNVGRLDPWTYELSSHPTIYFGCLINGTPVE